MGWAYAAFCLAAFIVFTAVWTFPADRPPSPRPPGLLDRFQQRGLARRPVCPCITWKFGVAEFGAAFGEAGAEFRHIDDGLIISA